MVIENRMIEELEFIYNVKGNSQVRSYYKTKKGIKHYYDFQELNDETKLNGSYDLLEISALIYYIENENIEY